MSYINISAYKFIYLSDTYLPELRETILNFATLNNVKGTVLLSNEGINLFVAGTLEEINNFTNFLSAINSFQDLHFKKSESTTVPFKRLKVRIKKEIIFMDKPDIQPETKTAPYIEPKELRQWYKQNSDMVILDTRNDYEFDHGSFRNAIHLDIQNFSEFPEALAKLPEEFKQKPIVTFCTGGIRCEKAAAFMLEQGFENVLQLNGGILNYFEQCGGDFYQGNCFVFDDRVAVNSELKPISEIST